tara:strand:+ start:1625 stop:2503 length:879 start_codon:yes stop_codon:yes gene_type:complete
MARYEYQLVSDALTNSPKEMLDNEATTLAARVCKELRVKMHPRNSASCWIYREDCPYILGWVGFGDYRDGGDGTPMYVVQARTIVNGKYAEYSKQYFMKMSTNFDVAVRNAKKFIRMMSPQELAGTRLRDASNAVDSVVDAAKGEFTEIRNKVIDVEQSLYSSRTNEGSTLLNELRHLMNSNYEFIDAMFGERLTDFFAKQDELNRLKGRTVPMWFVRVYERMDQQMFDVIDIDNAESSYKVEISDDVKRYTTDTLPEDIMQKLSVLNILQANDYVDDVGFSAGEGMFYVVR